MHHHERRGSGDGAAIALDLPWLPSKAKAQEQPSASEEAPAEEEEPVLTAPSPSLDESAKSPIMKGSPEREES